MGCVVEWWVMEDALLIGVFFVGGGGNVGCPLVLTVPALLARALDARSTVEGGGMADARMGVAAVRPFTEVADRTAFEGRGVAVGGGCALGTGESARLCSFIRFLLSTLTKFGVVWDWGIEDGPAAALLLCCCCDSDKYNACRCRARSSAGVSEGLTRCGA